MCLRVRYKLKLIYISEFLFTCVIICIYVNAKIIEVNMFIPSFLLALFPVGAYLNAVSHYDVWDNYVKLLDVWSGITLRSYVTYEMSWVN